MPELPEVERGRCLADSVAAGKRIHEVRVEPDLIVLCGLSPREVEAALLERRVVAVRRWGKQLWFEMEYAPHPLWHFGMTGAFHTPGVDALRLKAGPSTLTPAWPPRFLKVLLVFEDGTELAFCDARRFGRVALRDDPLNEMPIAALGFDPLLAPPSLIVLQQALLRRKTPIKSLLLNQKFVAGVGNWIADEVLYQARIFPGKRAQDLLPAEVARLRTKLTAIVKAAVACNADDAQYPKSWLFHRRWGKQAGRQTVRGEAIEFMSIGGRTTAWVPTVQTV